ncbi:MAG: type 1 glutamine amidotransferase domain-containing protein [Deltaproteobacteria bacterium]
MKMKMLKLAVLLLLFGTTLSGQASAIDAKPGKQQLNKRVLFVLSEFGYWGEELIGPLDVLEAAGYKVDFATPKGTKPLALPPSMDPNYVDPPLGRTVTTPDMAGKVKQVEASSKLDHPLNLTQWLPVKPYFSSPNYLSELFSYNESLDKVAIDVQKYDALVLVGGSGPILDMANNKRLHDLIRMFLKAGKPVAGECYGVAVLAFTRDEITEKSIIYGKRVTGHPLAFDYNDGHGYLKIDHGFQGAPYQLEFILKDAVGPDGQFIGNVGKKFSCIVDYPIITARTTGDSELCGQKLVEVLEKGVKRFGW